MAFMYDSREWGRQFVVKHLARIILSFFCTAFGRNFSILKNRLLSSFRLKTSECGNYVQHLVIRSWNCWNVSHRFPPSSIDCAKTSWCGANGASMLKFVKKAINGLNPKLCLHWFYLYCEWRRRIANKWNGSGVRAGDRARARHIPKGRRTSPANQILLGKSFCLDEIEDIDSDVRESWRKTGIGPRHGQMDSPSFKHIELLLIINFYEPVVNARVSNSPGARREANGRNMKTV